MLAIRQHEFGDPEVLRIEDVPDLQPAEGQVRIAVRSAGLHLIDTVIRRGESGGPYPLPELPMTPGREVAGVVDEVGVNADPSWLGRHVVAHLGMASGGYAEQAVTAESSLREIPDGLDADGAVALIGTGRTAMAILDHAAIAADDVVIVTAAAGGLGTLFVQAAAGAAATVVGLAGGAAKVARVRELGAHVAVDYELDGWPEVVREQLGERQPTVVLDGVGGDAGRAAFELLGSGGRIILFGWASGEITSFTSSDLAARGLTASWSIGPAMMKRFGSLEPLERMALEEAAAGRLTPVVGQRFALADAAEAHRAIETRATIGKTVLVP